MSCSEGCELVPCDGYLVCSRCGVVSEREICEDAEYRVFDEDDLEKVRVSGRSDDLLESLATQIVVPTRASGSRRGGKRGGQPSIELHARVTVSVQERQTKLAFERLVETCAQLGVVGPAKRTAKDLLKQFADAWYRHQLDVRQLRDSMSSIAEEEEVVDDDEENDSEEESTAATIAEDGSVQMVATQSKPTTSKMSTASSTRKTTTTTIIRSSMRHLKSVPMDEAFCTAMVFFALKRVGTPRTLRELAQRMRVKQALIKRGYHLISQYCPTTAADRTDAASLVERFCSRLGVAYGVVARARKIADELTRTTLHGRSPTTIAIGAVYLSLDPSDAVSRDPSVLAAASSGDMWRISRLLAELDRAQRVVITFAPSAPPSTSTTPALSPRISSTPQIA